MSMSIIFVFWLYVLALGHIGFNAGVKLIELKIAHDYSKTQKAGPRTQAIQAVNLEAPNNYQEPVEHQP